MKPLQRQMMRHALGLDVSRESYRNRYTCGTQLAEDLWMELCGDKLAAMSTTGTFHVTRAGFELVVDEGESAGPDTFHVVDELARKAALEAGHDSTDHHRRVKALKAKAKARTP